MSEIEDKLGAILNNPQMMQQIMSLAQNFGNQQDSSPQKQPPIAQEAPSGLDLGMVQKIAGLAKQSGIDHREQALLNALRAYLSNDRIGRLEKAMRAAKMAKLASHTLGAGALHTLFGR